MKRLFFVLMLFVALPLFAQDSRPGVQYVQIAPSGRCGYQPPIEIVMLTGATYVCANGNWTQSNPGGNVVNSINGVPGPFLFTGAGVACTATTCVFAGVPSPIVNSINGTGGPFTFSGTGVNCTGNSCTFGGGGSGGVLSINGQPGTFVFTGAGVSCTGTTCTFTTNPPGVTSINGNNGTFTFTGSGVTCTGTSCVFTASSGGVNPAVPHQLGNYTSTGNNVQGAPALYSLDPSMSLTQINGLFSGMSGSNNVIIPASMPQQIYSTNNQVTKDFRLGADYFQMPGIACDGRQSALTIAITSGSNISNVGSLLSAADIGKTFFFFNRTGYTLADSQNVWTPTLTGYTYPNATWSSNAPFSANSEVYYGTDNLATVNAAMTQASAAFPLTIPSGCGILVNGTIPWNNAQVIHGRHDNQGGFIGRPGIDVIATTDTSGQSISLPGVGLSGFYIKNGTEVDATLGYNLYSANGALTVVPPIYRPAYTHSPLAPAPLAPGWLTGGKNGVASITQNSAVICTPNAYSPPAVGQQIMFPYFASIFTSTVSSTAGSCSTGFTARTMAAAFPNTGTYTMAQAEWFTGSAIQSTTTTIPTSITYPLTLTTTLSTDPAPGWITNFPQHGTLKVCGIEAEYLGITSTSVTLRRGPATSAGCTGTTAMAPVNMCRAKNLLGSNSDQPWPVTATINSGDSTPSGANWFPGECVGNAAIAFPEANGNVYVGTGLVGGYLDDINFIGTSGISSQNANNAAGIYVAGNNAPFGSHFSNLVGQGLQYDIVQGPASSGQHGVEALGPTGFGNTYHNLWFFGAFPLSFVDMQGSDLTDLNMNSTEYSPFDGSQIGSSTCLHMGFTLDEQTGNGVTSTQYDRIGPYGCEPENGSHAELNPAVSIDGQHISFDTANFEGIPNVFGGDHLHITNSYLGLPAIDYGNENDFGTVDGSNAGYITNIWDPVHPQFLEWGRNAKCSAFAGGNGPSVACGASTVQGYQGRGIEPSITGSKPFFLLGGMITPWMWDANGAFDINPFTRSGTTDPTATYWGASSQCNVGGGALCHTHNFNTQVNGGFLYIGPFNQLYDGPYNLDAAFKSVAGASSFTLLIKAVDSGTGQCSSPATLYTGTVTTTTSWPTAGNDFTAAVDMTGHAGCVLDVSYTSGSTTDTILTDRFNFVPAVYATGHPAGSDGQVQVNIAGSFGTDATFTFNNSVHTLGTLNETMQAQGVASLGNNEPSGTLSMEADVCTGTGPCNPTPVFYSQQVFVGGGANPYTLMDWNCTPGSSTGTCQGDYDYPLVTTSGSLMAVADALYFGAKGDAYQPPDGFNTSASSTTVIFNDDPLTSTAVDGGKDVWITGVGAAGVAFHATIVTVVNSHTAVLSAAPASNASNVRGVFGHDDAAAVQECFQYSATNGIQCVLKAKPNPGFGLTGFLIGSQGLQLVSDNGLEGASSTNVTGAGQVNGTNLFCEFNGDCLSLAAGAIQGSNVTNLSIQEDQSQANSRGIHLNPQPGTFGNGPFTNGNFTNVSVYNPAKECIWFDGGGGVGYGYNLPNQYVNMTQFWCSGPTQSHPANLILMTGQAAQIVWINGQVNADVWNGTSVTNYPNPVISITEKTSGLGDTPVDVKFYGYTYEVATQGLAIGNGANNIHFDSGYIENVSSPLIVTGSVGAVTFNGNHIANSGGIGGIAQFAGGETASMRDNFSYGTSPSPAAFAVCTGSGNAIDFAANNALVTTTSTCQYAVSVSGGTLAANTCSGSPTTLTMTGLKTSDVVIPGYSSDPSGLAGWGSTGGMEFKAWPSAANTLSWKLCNPTSGSITYSPIAFNVVFKE